MHPRYVASLGLVAVPLLLSLLGPPLGAGQSWVIEVIECQMNSPRLRLDNPLVVGERAYKPIAITQFRLFVVYGWFIQRRSHIVCV